MPRASREHLARPIRVTLVWVKPRAIAPPNPDISSCLKGGPKKPRRWFGVGGSACAVCAAPVPSRLCRCAAACSRTRSRGRPVLVASSASPISVRGF
jgi:hypothetical protein